MNRRDELEAIRDEFMSERSITKGQANQVIGDLLEVLPGTVATWLSINSLGFPTNPITQKNLDLLRFKLGKD